jgi:spermidine/putrescine transport system ATP-binding protein
MQLELKALNKELGITFVYVTHDQEEALTMSDRIAVMDRARIAQMGTPAEIYENPRNSFVAGFIGQSNFFQGRATRSSDGGWFMVLNHASCRLPLDPELRDGTTIRIAVRPEWLSIRRPDGIPEASNALLGVIRDIVYRGETLHVIVGVAEVGDVTAAVRNDGQILKPLTWKVGQSVAVTWVPEDCQILSDG